MVLDGAQGFTYLDQRELLGLVDGMANPIVRAALDCVLLDDVPTAPPVPTLRCKNTRMTWPPGVR